VVYLIGGFRAAVYYEKGDFDAAIKDCDAAVEKARELRADFTMIAKALARKGNALVKMGCLEEAITAYNKSLTEHRSADTLKRLNEAEKALKVGLCWEAGNFGALSVSLQVIHNGVVCYQYRIDVTERTRLVEGRANPMVAPHASCCLDPLPPPHTCGSQAVCVGRLLLLLLLLMFDPCRTNGKPPMSTWTSALKRKSWATQRSRSRSSLRQYSTTKKL
jgi:hypothetical protein